MHAMPLQTASQPSQNISHPLFLRIRKRRKEPKNQLKKKLKKTKTQPNQNH